MSVTKAHTLLEASNFYLWLKVFLEAITAKQLGGKEKEKKIMAARQGLGQLPMHGVCAFTTAHLNQYMSNSAWNTISLCVPKKKKKDSNRKYTEGRLKTSSVFLLKALTFGMYTAFRIYDRLFCAAPLRKGFTNTVLMCQPSLSLCSAFVPGDIKLQPRSWTRPAAVTCLNRLPTHS